MKLSSRSRMGSDNAPNDRASVSAMPSSRVSARTGVQQAIGSSTGAALRICRLYPKFFEYIDVYQCCATIISTIVNMKETTMSRVQLALNVEDLDASIAFYTKLFQTPPAKVRENYANFAIADPPLKLVLFANDG